MPRFCSLFLPILSLLFFLIPGTATAQFEGTIEFRSWIPDRADIPVRSLQLTTNRDRVLMAGDANYKLVAGLDANGLLVRNDREDFVFFSGENDALRISREDVDGLASMMRRFYGMNHGSSEWEGRVEETGVTETIQGYECEQILLFENGTGNHLSVWLTTGIKINWGVLQEVWSRSMADVIQVDLPVELFMNRNSFPLRVEYYEGDQLAMITEAAGVDRESVQENRVEIPENINMIGLTDLMMRMMRDRR